MNIPHAMEDHSLGNVGSFLWFEHLSACLFPIAMISCAVHTVLNNVPIWNLMNYKLIKYAILLRVNECMIPIFTFSHHFHQHHLPDTTHNFCEFSNCQNTTSKIRVDNYDMSKIKVNQMRKKNLNKRENKRFHVYC